MGEFDIIISPEILLIINLVFILILVFFVRKNFSRDSERQNLDETLSKIQSNIDRMSDTQHQIQGQIKTSGEMHVSGQNNINSLYLKDLTRWKNLCQSLLI